MQERERGGEKVEGEGIKSYVYGGVKERYLPTLALDSLSHTHILTAGGFCFSKNRRVCSTKLENLGPIAT